MAWNNNIQQPNWAGNPVTNPKVLNVSSIYTNYLEASNIYSLNGSIAFLSNLVLNTGVIQLGITPTTLTAQNGALYVDGQAVSIPTALSNISHWALFPALADVNMNLSTIYNVKAISTLVINSCNVNASNITSQFITSSNITASNINVKNLTSSNILFDTLNGRAGTITTLSGSNSVYTNTFNTNATITNVNVGFLECFTNIRSLGLSSITLSTVTMNSEFIVGNVATVFGQEVKTLLDSKFSLLSTINNNFISSGRGVFSTINVNTLSTNVINSAQAFLSSIVASNITSSNVTSSNVIARLLSTISLNAGTTNITNMNSSNITSSNATIRNITASNITSSNVTSRFLSTISISTNTINASNAILTNISNININTENITLRTTIPNQWSNSLIYAIGDTALYQSNYYVAIVGNLDVNPTLNIPLWVPNTPYVKFQCAYVDLVGSYVCTSNTIGPGDVVPPNSDFAHWSPIGVTNLPTNVWTVNNDIVVSGITGDNLSFVIAGNGTFNTLNVSNIASSNIITSNIFSQNISNANSITNGGNATIAGNATTGSLNVTNNATLNTLTTNGTYTANGNINVINSINLATADTNNNINGTTTTNPSPLGTQTRFWNSLYNIKNIECESITITGGGTGNEFFTPYRNNSIVNIGETEFSPAIVSIYGFNPLGDTTALSVEGELNVTLGSFNSYYVANFYPINIEANAINVYGISFLNGGVVVTGLLEAQGAITITGLTTIIGNLNVTGLITLTGATNVLGLLTAEAGIAIVGATSINGGDIIIGSSPGGGVANNFNVYIYYNGLDIQNITVNGTGDFRQWVTVDGFLTVDGVGTFNNSVNVNGTLTASNFITSNIITPNITATTINTSNLTVHTSANIDTQLYLRQNDTIGSLPTLTFENTTTAKSALIDLTALGSLNFSSEDIAIGATSNLALSGDSNVAIASANPIQVYSQISLKEYPALNPNPTKLTFENEDATKSASIEFDSSIDLLTIQASNLTFTGTQTASLTAPQANLIGQTNIGIFAGRTVNVVADSNVYMKGISSIVLESDDIVLNGLSNIYMNSVSTITLKSDDIVINGLSNAVMFSELGNVLVASGIQTAISGGVVINIQSGNNIDIGAGGNIFAQSDGEMTLNSFSNTLITATGTIAIGATGDAQFVSSSGRVIIASGGSNDIEINAVGSGGSIIANTFGTGGILLYNGSNNGIGINDTGVNLGSDSDINLTASNTINLSSTGDTTIIGNDIGIIAQDTLVLSGVTNVTIEAGQVDFIDSSNINFNNTTLSNIGTLYVNNVIGSNITSPSLSTISISTGTIFLSSINALNNINVGKSLVPFTGSNLDLGGLGSNFRQLFVSSIRCVSSIITPTIATDRIVGCNSATNIYTNNLFPLTSGAQIGYGATLAGGGYYNFGFHRSTFTTNINPATDGATTANNIKVTGHLSTVSLGVSTINFKAYPFISTLNNSVATASVSVAGVPVLTRIQSNTLTFPRPGTYRIDQEYSLTKSAGGANQGTHGSLIYASNGATTATISNATNWTLMAMSAVPFQDKTGFSTFTSVSATILANSANLTRDVFYYDSGTGNYTVDFYLAQPNITYIPSPGITPDI
jgi:hypothetical protein